MLTSTLTSKQALGRRKRAELTSALGAGVLGTGIGVLLASYLSSYGLVLLIVGALVHGWGMLDRHRLERSEVTERVVWAEALYWTCWLGLAALAGYIAFRTL